jgi:hypothetical protein
MIKKGTRVEVTHSHSDRYGTIVRIEYRYIGRHDGGLAFYYEPKDVKAIKEHKL